MTPAAIAATPAAAPDARLAAIRETAGKFEASFLSIMLQQAFEGVGDGPFSGGPGEAMFKSFLMDAMGKQMTRAGGVGLASQVQREMLKMQGLNEEIADGARR